MESTRKIHVVRLISLLIGVTGILLMAGLTLRTIAPTLAYNSLATVTTRDWYVPGGSMPWGTAFDKSGNVWQALPGCDPSPTCSSSTPPGKIAVFNPQYTAWPHLYQLPAGFGQPLFLAFDQSGKLWFPMPMTNSLGMYDPVANVFQQWPVPTAGSGPWGVAVDHLGNIWFTEHYGNKIGCFNPTSQTFTEISTPAANSQPYGITVDGANNIWFTENNSAVALIGKYSTGGGLQEYKIRTGSTSGLTPHQIAVDPQGNLWWSEGWVSMIGKLTVAQAQPGTNNGVAEYGYKPTCSTCGSHTSGISVDSNGLVWFDDSLQSIIGAFPMSGSGSFALYNTPTGNSHPHDGLNVDASNNIWFDEEFANKLAEATQSGTTGTPTPTASPSPSVTVTPSPTITPGATVAQDTFQRANQSFWGTASDGLKWGSDASTNGAFSINGNTGLVTNGSGSYSAVLGAPVTNANEVFSGSISSFNNTNFGAVLRWSDGNNWYKAYLDGKNLVIQKKVSGSTSIVATVPFTANAGTAYSLRFQAVGTTLSAKAWVAGSAEPANWMATGNDSAFSSGYCGLRMLVQNGAKLSITAFLASSL